MCASSWARGVPDVSQFVDRRRLSALIGQGGSRVSVLVAPSGYGKSVAAAQFALQCEFSIWIEAAPGAVCDGRVVAQETLRSLRSVFPDLGVGRRDGLEPIQLADLLDAIETAAEKLPVGDLCIVVDDVPSASLGELVVVARRMGASLRKRAVFVFTTRELPGAGDEIVRNCTVLGADDLKLTELEAVELLEMSQGESAAPERAAELRAECNGHVALFSVLSRNVVAEARDLASPATSASLQLWLRHLLCSQLDESQRRIAAAMALLRSGTSTDLRAVGLDFAEDDVHRVSTVVPLIAVEELPSGRMEFAVHDSVVEYWACNQRAWLETCGIDMVYRSVSVLTASGNLPRAASALARTEDVELCASWLLEHGAMLLDESHPGSLMKLLELIPLSTLFAEPKLLLLSAAVAMQAEQYEDALARSKAALSLAEHSGDIETKIEAISRAVHCLCNLGQFDRASELAADLMGQPLDEVAGDVSASALLALGIQAAARGEFAESERALSRVRKLVGGGGQDSRTGMLACLFESILPGLAEGDFVKSARLLAPFIDCEHLWLTDRLGARGNLAVCLCETGRLERARLILTEVIDHASKAGLRAVSGCFLPTLGSVEAGLGSVPDGIALLVSGIKQSLEAGDEQSAQVNRIYLATVLRGDGSAEESLMHAERAYEHLSVVDVFRCRRLAALEVAANFLALGDVCTAQAWTRAAVDEGFDGNQYHRLRADMIMAEIERRSGRTDDAVSRLSEHARYIGSGNSNWQIAMYSRAFPQMLPLIALAIGVDALPGHLLRMIPVEHAERALVSCQSDMDAKVWRALGQRLLGEEELRRLELTGSVPICHVRVFGGLEVSVGGRTIRERDWRKRKARTLFAMLVIRRGQDTPREQILEHLWPDMDEDRAKNNLYVAWSTMKSVLGGDGSAGTQSPYVETAHGVCKAIGETTRTDIDEFEEALARANMAIADGDQGAILESYGQVASTYRGDILPGDVYDDWFDSVRVHYRTRYIDAMQRAANCMLAHDDGMNALAFARRAIEADRLREDLYQVQMRCQIQACQRSSAIDTYFACVRLLADELGLDPSTETRALYDEILAMENKPSSVNR